MLILLNFLIRVTLQSLWVPKRKCSKIFSVSCNNANYFVPRSVNYDMVILTHAVNATLEWSGDL